MNLRAADRDPRVDPGVDFYRFANGGWLDANPIPAGYGAWGSFEEVIQRNDVILRDLLEAAAAHPRDDLDRMLGDYFAAGMDLAAIEAAGLGPIRPLLDRIDALASHDDVAALLPVLHRSGIFAFYGVAVTVDHDDSTKNLLWFAQAGLGLPDRDAYSAEGDTPAAIRAAYAGHVARQLANVGVPVATTADLARAVLELETRLAALHLRAEEARDPKRTLNRRDLAELDDLAPHLRLPRYLDALGAGAADTVNVQNPGYLAGLHEIIVATDLATLRAYLTFHVVKELAEALPAVVDDEAFAFYGRRIRGQQEQLERFKRVIGAMTADVGEALSQRYVAAAFPASAKERALAMVAVIVAEMRHSLETRAWMGEQTRSRALAKLRAMGVKIGYPDRWRDWSGLSLDRASYAQNRLAAARHEMARQLAKLGQTVDEGEWEMPPHMVNAYYHPTRNEIVFPAAILQPPMFDPDADDAVNFGGIGTVIAPEITHGFDDEGRHFDADGAFRDWWTAEDEAQFNALTDRLVEQFDDYVVVDDVHVNGRLTLGENIADLGGLALAQRALARVAGEGRSIEDQDLETGSEAEPEAAVEGWSPIQRFFLANATIWRANISPELQRTLAQVDPHSPRPLRIKGPVSNLESFRAAFGLEADAAALRPREQRLEIW